MSMYLSPQTTLEQRWKDANDPNKNSDVSADYPNEQTAFEVRTFIICLKSGISARFIRLLKVLERWRTYKWN